MTQNDKKEILRGVFSRGAAGYGNIGFFPIFGKHLVEVAELQRGAKVLDVACGRGASLFPAAEKVGPEGEITGVDLSEGMVRETKAEIEKSGIKNVQVRQMDAESLQFSDDAFDVIQCGFALQFFPNLDRGLAEFHRVLKPGGRVVVTTWSDYEDPRWDWFEDVRSKYGEAISLGTNNLETPEKIKPWFQRASFVDIDIRVWKFDAVYPSEADYWNLRSSTSLRATLEKLEPATQEKLRKETFQRMQAIKERDGFHDLLEAHFTVARKSD